MTNAVVRIVLGSMLAGAPAIACLHCGKKKMSNFKQIGRIMFGFSNMLHRQRFGWQNPAG
jgi:hypothetical protein